MRRVDKLVDELTYRDLAGRRRLRHYAVASLALFILIGGIFLLGWQLQQQFRVEAVSTPWTSPVSQTAFQGASLPDVGRGGTPPVPSPGPTDAPNSCLNDPAAWQLEEIPGSNLERIIPECVYAGLARTVAWELMAESMGYIGTEAAQRLGFPDLPFKPQAQMAIPTDRGPYEMSLHLNFAYFAGRSWYLTADLQPALTYFLQGCFRTNIVKDREVGYPVVCSVGRDLQKVGTYMEAQGYHFGRLEMPEEAVGTHTRRFALFGYQGDGLWVYLGIQDQPEMQLSKLGDDPREWRARQAGLHGVKAWDAAWVERAFGYSMLPLPEGWQTHTDPQAARTIARIMSDYLQPLWEKGADRP